MRHTPSIFSLSGCFLLLMLATGCGSFKDITVSNAGNFKISPAGDGKFLISVDAQVHNPTFSKIKLTSATLNLQHSKSPFATLTLTEPVTIARRSDDVQTLNMELQLRSVLLALMGFRDLSIDELTINGKFTATAMMKTQTHYIKMQPLKEFEAQFGDVFSAFLKK